MKRCLAFLLFACSLLAHAADQTILVVESYHAEFAWDAAYRDALTRRLAPEFGLEFFEMDTKRLPPDRHPAMAQKALARIKQQRPVLVILGDDAALKSLGREIERLEIPAVYLGINNNPRFYNDGRMFAHITGVLERPLIKRSIAFVRQIVPDTRRVLVLFDKDLTSTIIGNEVFYGRESLSIEGVEVVFQQYGTFSEWQRAVLEAKDKGFQAIFAGLYQALKGAGGATVDAEEVITWTSRKTAVPLFGFWDFAIGPDKSAGGLVCSGKEQGNAAAEIALKILRQGEKPAAIPPRTAPQGNLVFSRKQLSRFGLSVPPALASHVQFVD